MNIWWWLLAGLVIAVISLLNSPWFRRWRRRNHLYVGDTIEDDDDWRND